MSTKIYNGYRYRGSFYRLHESLMAFAETARSLIQDRYDARVAEEAARYLDSVALGRWKGETWKWPLSSAVDEVRKAAKEIRVKGLRDPLNDFTFSACLFPRRNEILIIRYCEDNVNEDVLKAWNKIEGIEYYGYWNNTDRPDDVTAAEWIRRSKVWDEVLPGLGVPALRGYTVDVVTDRCNGLRIVPGSKDILPKIPSKKERAKRWAMDLATSDKLNGLPKKEWDWVDVTDAIRAATEDKKLLREKERWVSDKLPTITKTLLIGGDSGTGKDR